MYFRIEVAKSLLAAQQNEIQESIPRRRGRPSKSGAVESAPSLLSSQSDTDSSDSIQPKRKKIFQIPPPQEVRLDQKMHLPLFLNVKSAGRCKAKHCNKSSYIICEKCNVYLCVKRESNCFEEFHKNK